MSEVGPHPPLGGEPLLVSYDEARMRQLLGSEEVHGGYAIGAVLGRGGMGEVREGYALATGQPLVFKSLPPEWAADAGRLTRLRKEAELLGRLHHPGIPQFVDFDRIGNRLCLVMELIEGTTWEEWHETNPAVSARAEMVEGIARAVAHAHAQGVVHRDLKPSNLLIREDGRPAVLDFGIGILIDVVGTAVGGMTLTGQTPGTPHWMAPEQTFQTSGPTPAPAMDVYGLGLLLFYSLTGRLPVPPRPGENALSYWARRSTLETARLRNEKAAIPRSLADLCEVALRTDPAKRPSALEFAEDLGRWLRNEPIHARPPGTLTRAILALRRHPVPWALLLLLVVALALTAWMQGQSAARESAAKAAADTALQVSLRTQSMADTMTAAEAVQRGAADDALPWLARALRRDPGNRTAGWLAGQILLDRPRIERQVSVSANVPDAGPDVEESALTPDGFLCLTRETRRLFCTRIAHAGSEISCQEWPPHDDGDLTGPGVLTFALSPDATRVAVAGAEGEVNLYEWPSGVLLWSRSRPPDRLRSLVFSPSGHEIAVIETAEAKGNKTATLQIFLTTNGDAGSGEITLPGDCQNTPCVFTGDGRWLLLRQNLSNSLWRIDVRTGSVCDQGQAWREISYGSCHFVVPVPGTPLVILAGQAQGYRAALLDVSEGTLRWGDTMEFARPGYTVSPKWVLLSDDARHFLSVGTDGSVTVRNTADGTRGGAEMRLNWIPERAFLRGDLLVIHGSTRTEIWNWRTGRRVSAYLQPYLWPCADGQFLSVRKGAAQLWAQPASGTDAIEIVAGTGTTGFELNGTRDKLLAAGVNAGACIWDLTHPAAPVGRMAYQTGDTRIKPRRRLIPRPRLSANGREALTWLSPSRLGLYSLTADGTLTGRVSVVDSPASPFVCASLSPDGRLACACCLDGSWKAWDVVAGVERHNGTDLQTAPVDADTRGDPGVAMAMEFSPDGTRMAIGTERWCTTSVWNTGNWKPTQPPSLHGQGVSVLAFGTGKSQTVWTGDWIGKGSRYDLNAYYSAAHPPPGIRHLGPVADLRISPDGSTLATASWDRTAILWNAGTLEPFLPSLMHYGEVSAIDWSPDGQRVVTASLDGEVFLWDPGTRTRLYSFPQPCAVIQAAFALNGERLVLARIDGRILVIPLYPYGQLPSLDPGNLDQTAGVKLDDSGGLISVTPE